MTIRNALPVHEALTDRQPARTCALAACPAGSQATVVDVGCTTDEACRLRALGLCEGTSVSILDVRHAMVIDVRGTRLALGTALTAGITVQPHPAHAD